MGYPDSDLLAVGRHGLRRLPVVDGKQLVGTVWITDLAIASHDQPTNVGHV